MSLEVVGTEDYYQEIFILSKIVETFFYVRKNIHRPKPNFRAHFPTCTMPTDLEASLK